MLVNVYIKHIFLEVVKVSEMELLLGMNLYSCVCDGVLIPEQPSGKCIVTGTTFYCIAPVLESL